MQFVREPASHVRHPSKPENPDMGLDLLGYFEGIFYLLAGNRRQANQFGFRSDGFIQVGLEGRGYALIY